MTRKNLVLASVLTAMVGLTGCNSSSKYEERPDDHDHGHDHGHVAGAVRALFSDENGALKLYNIEDGTVAWEHSFDGIDASSLSGLRTTEDGRFGIINLRGAENRVRFLDSGVFAEEHGDHHHLEVEDPELLDYSVDGDDYGASRLAHVVSRDERISIFFDGESGETTSAIAITIPVANLTASSPEAAGVLSDNRHHGVSIPAEEGAVIMSAGDGSANRTGVRVYEDTDVVGDFSDRCSGLHGYAVIGDHYLFGCNNDQGGILVVTHDHDGAEEWTAHQVDFPAGATNGVSNFAVHPELGFALSPWGNDAMIRVHPESEAMSEDDILELPAQQCGYALRDDNAEHLLVLTIDGMLRAYDATDWSEGPAVQVMEAFECSGTRPILASVGSFAYLTVPSANELLEIEVEDDDLEIHQTISLQGEPRRMTLFRHPAGLDDHDH